MKGIAVHDEAAALPLARTPGFHGLARTQLFALNGPGAATLKVWCACEPELAIATVAVGLTSRGGSLPYVERGRGEIEVLEGIDLQTVAGHFLLLAPWKTKPDGWQPIGPITKGPVRPRKSATLVSATESKLRTAIRTSAPCACGHDIAFHDPCSKCQCPGYHTSKKTERFKRRA